MGEAEKLVQHYALLCGARSVSLFPPVPVGQSKALIFAPHPDDECIIGALPLRLQREAGFRIINVPVTLGSNVARRAARKAELAAACAVLGFDIMELAAQSFTDVRPQTRTAQPILWEGMVTKIATLLLRERPEMIFVPHRLDQHDTHIGTHHLVLEALAKLPEDFSTRIVFTEYWQPQQEPNLLVECPPEDLTRLVTALMCHQGEIARNPYHRSLPAWMIDNARRGAERVGGEGTTALPIGFATLYQIGQWQRGRYQPVAADVIVPSDQAAATVLSLSV
jgi:LmbE family N-acetylglucosaminyl deacetylase